MPKYIIERDMPNAGKLNEQELRAASQKSCDVLQKLGPQVQWIESFVTDEKVYCVYIAPNEEIIREHARQGGFPANRISAVRSASVQRQPRNKMPADVRSVSACKHVITLLSRAPKRALCAFSARCEWSGEEHKRNREFRNERVFDGPGLRPASLRA